MMEDQKIAFSKLLIHLLKGVVYSQESELWPTLLNQQNAVQDYIAMLGLQLIVDEAEGYAYVRQKPQEEGNAESLPRLIARRQLSLPVSLLCLLLRKRLLEHDASGGEVRLILTEQQIVEMLRLYLPSGNNEARVEDQSMTAIKKVIELGILRRLSSDASKLEVKRIIKALVDADWLADLEQKIKEYEDYAKHTA